jgi:hypothetical protein
MFERFTDRARRVVVLAQEEARLLDHGYIGTEHILLSLVREGTAEYPGSRVRLNMAATASLEGSRLRADHHIGPSTPGSARSAAARRAGHARAGRGGVDDAVGAVAQDRTEVDYIPPAAPGDERGDPD